MFIEDPLLKLAVVLVAGIVGGELLGLLRLPKVTGWIGTGIVLRAVGIPGLGAAEIGAFSPFTNFVLGFIAFSVGATLHVASLRNTGARLGLLLLAEAVLTPIIVLAALVAAGLDTSVALVLGAIAIAGAPGTTVIVVQEARARGILSRTLIAAVGLIDMVAVGWFAFASSVLSDMAAGEVAWQQALVGVGSEFGVALAVGAGCAAVALLLARTVLSPAFLGPIMVAVILAAWGLARAVDVSSILACTFAGIAVSNLRHESARSAEAYLQPFSGVLFAGFYTFAGMRLDFGMVVPLAGLVAVYFGARLAGKSLGAYLAMRLSRAPVNVRRFLGLALMPHGGVAVGLIFVVQEMPALAPMADTVAALGLATLAVNQLIGPSATRFALGRAEEAGKDRPRLLDFLSEQRIVTGLRATTKEQVIRQLAERLYATSAMPVAKEEFVQDVLAREQERSTCLGEGFMIPHATLDEGEEVRGVLGLSKEGLDLNATDGKKVHAVVLLATPHSDRHRHLEVLAAFATAITGDANLREQLYYARNPARAYEVLHADAALEMNYFLDEAKSRRQTTAAAA